MAYGNVLEGLKDVYGRLNKIGDDLLSLVEMENDPEIKAILSDLSNQAYQFSVDTKDTAETYVDLQGESLEDGEDVMDQDNTNDTVPSEDTDELEPNV